MTGFRSVKQTAEAWGVSERWVNQYLLEGRIPNAERIGRMWVIPEDAAKPEKQAPGVKKKQPPEKPDR